VTYYGQTLSTPRTGEYTKSLKSTIPGDAPIFTDLKPAKIFCKKITSSQSSEPTRLRSRDTKSITETTTASQTSSLFFQRRITVTYTTTKQRLSGWLITTYKSSSSIKFLILTCFQTMSIFSLGPYRLLQKNVSERPLTLK
jgi:hypothetical protein